MPDMNSEKIKKITKENHSPDRLMMMQPEAGVIPESLQLARQNPLLQQFKEDVRNVLKDPNILLLDRNTAKDVLEHLYSSKNPKEFNAHIPPLFKASGDIQALAVHAKINADTSASLERLLQTAAYFKNNPLIQYPK